jgi:hypothetical protein
MAELGIISAKGRNGTSHERAIRRCFVTAGFLSYAEPAKWVARLQASKTDTHDLLFKTDMSARPQERSGRLGSIKESSLVSTGLAAMSAEKDDQVHTICCTA